MENVAHVTNATDAAAEARRIKQREYQAAYKARHPDVIKAAKDKWHAQVRMREMADPALLEIHRAKSRAYNQSHPDVVKAAKLRYKERQRNMRVVLALAMAEVATMGMPGEDGGPRVA